MSKADSISPILKPKQLRRFLMRLALGGHEACWLWQAGLDPDGYGRIKFNWHRYRTHRLAWLLFCGPIPDGIQVCHACDVNYTAGDIQYRRCCNPAHLYLATSQENTRHAQTIGRLAAGERNANCQLTQAAIQDVRRNYRPRKVPYRIFAERYGVSIAQIQRAFVGLAWAHVKD